MNRSALTLPALLAVLAVQMGCAPDTETRGADERVQVRGAGLTLKLPPSWVGLDPAEAREAVEDEDRMAALVDGYALATKDESLLKGFITITAVPPPGKEPVFAASAAEVNDDVLARMTVGVTDLDGLPSDAELEKSYRGQPLGVEYLDVTDTDTSVGHAVLIAFKTEADNPSLHWARLLVDTGSGVTDISIVTSSRRESEQIALSTAASLERLD